MVTLNCDESAVRHQLEKICDGTRQAGGVLSDRLVICQTGSEMHLESQRGDTPSGNSEGEVLATLSGDCLMPLDGPVLGLAGDQIQIRSLPGDWLPARRDLFVAMIDLYNLTGLVGDFQRRWPFVALAGHPVLGRLLAGRSARMANRMGGDLQRLGAEARMLRAFLASRARIHMDGGGGRRIAMLAPILDLAAHHPKGGRLTLDNGRPRMVASHVPKGGNQIFVWQGDLDPLDIYMEYGRLDRQEVQAHSIPMHVELPGLGAIDILGERIVDATESASDDQDTDGGEDKGPTRARIKMPNMGYVGATAKISHLPLPGPETPKAMIRVLGLIIRKMAERTDSRPPRDVLRHAEAQVVLANRRFFMDLQTALDDPAIIGAAPEPAIADARQVVARQVAILRAYRMAS